jgi:UDP:flavonoid glycosyltransferase YjiC (YdhE family)
MRAAIVCHDTRGGIQPYLGLGLGLRRAGHEIVVVAPEGYRGFVESVGLECRGMAGNVQAYMNSPEVAAAMERGFWAIHKLMIEKTGEMVRDTAMACLAACAGSDVVLGGFGGMIVGESVAEKLGIPFIQAHLQPLATTAVYPGLLSLKWLRGLGPANRLSHAVSKQVFWQPMRAAVNAARRDLLGLPPCRFWGSIGVLRRPGDVILYGYSPALLPRPRDVGAGHHVTGYWFLDHDRGWTPPPGLAEFLDAGPPPVAIGFGSMGSRDAEATTRLALAAAERAGQRVVLLAGWGGLSNAALPDTAFLTDAVPHSWLFPRCSLAVHHGGAGTTGAALRAGVPSVVVPFGADQPFWGWLVSSKELGACCGSRRRLTAANLARAITTTLSNKAVLGRTAEMGHRVRLEDGVREAVAVLERVNLVRPVSSEAR